MKWLLMVVAFVLGAAITWFLTVKRVSRTVPVGADTGPATSWPDPDEAASAGRESAAPEPVPVVSPGEPVAGAVGIAGGADLVAAATAGVLPTEAADGPDDEPELPEVVDEAGFGGTPTPVSESRGAAEAWDRDAEDEDALLSKRPGVQPAREDDVEAAESEEPEEPPVAVAPVADATPNGDVAGVGEPAIMATVDERIERDQSDDTGSGSTQAATARPTQGELTFDEPETSVPPEDRP